MQQATAAYSRCKKRPLSAPASVIGAVFCVNIAQPYEQRLVQHLPEPRNCRHSIDFRQARQASQILGPEPVVSRILTHS